MPSNNSPYFLKKILSEKSTLSQPEFQQKGFFVQKASNPHAYNLKLEKPISKIFSERFQARNPPSNNKDLSSKKQEIRTLII